MEALTAPVEASECVAIAMGVQEALSEEGILVALQFQVNSLVRHMHVQVVELLPESLHPSL